MIMLFVRPETPHYNIAASAEAVDIIISYRYSVYMYNVYASLEVHCGWVRCSFVRHSICIIIIICNNL